MGLPAEADTENVTMLSAYSPSLMKLLLDGESLGEWIDDNGDEVVMQTKPRRIHTRWYVM